MFILKVTEKILLGGTHIKIMSKIIIEKNDVEKTTSNVETDVKTLNISTFTFN